MPKYRKKPVVVTADRWFRMGDHPAVVPYTSVLAVSSTTDSCGYCGQPLAVHGWIKTLEGGHVVCPGSWVITGVKGEMYPCAHDVFLATYEREVESCVECLGTGQSPRTETTCPACKGAGEST